MQEGRGESRPVFEALGEGAVGARRVVFEAEVLVDLEEALMVEELAIEAFLEGGVAEQTKHGAADFLVVEEGGQFEVFGPEACALGDEEGVDDIGEHLVDAGFAD